MKRAYHRRQSALVLDAYMKARARDEGVMYALDAAFFRKALAKGIQGFFGVEIDSHKPLILRDDQNPQFLARYQRGDG